MWPLSYAIYGSEYILSHKYITDYKQASVIPNSIARAVAKLYLQIKDTRWKDNQIKQ